MNDQDYTRFWHQNQNFMNDRGEDQELRHFKRQSWNSDVGMRHINPPMYNAGGSPRNPLYGQTDKRYVPVFGQKTYDQFQMERNGGFDNRAYMSDSFIPDQRRARSSFGSQDGQRMNFLRSEGRPTDYEPVDYRSVISAQPYKQENGYTIYKGQPASEPGGRSKKSEKDLGSRKRTKQSNGELPDKPAWMRSFDSSMPRENGDFETDSLDKGKDQDRHGNIPKRALVFKLFVICLIIWDFVNDWMMAGAGPIHQILNDASADEKLCLAGSNKTALYLFSNTTEIISICSDSNILWMALVGFAILGSLITVIQVINIALEIIKGCVSSVFQIFHGQSEVCFAMFLKEIPQAAILTPLFYYCDCSNVHKNMYLYALLASISAVLSSTFRYVSSFNGVGGDEGCCNNWWRCCCCRDKDYCCRVTAKETFCKCELPIPFCCCTATCENCKWAPKTWCAPLLKAFSCYCTCCRSDVDLYGIRLVNLLLLLLLWAAMTFQIMFFVIQLS